MNWTTKTTTKIINCDENRISNECYYFYDENTTKTKKKYLRNDSLEDVCKDFERTLERSRKIDDLIGELYFMFFKPILLQFRLLAIQWGFLAISAST